VSNLNVAVGDFVTYITGEYSWSIEKLVDNATLGLAIGELPKTVKYTVRVTKNAAMDSKYFVGGYITVTNPGTKPVDVSAVSVTAGTAAVPAKCPGTPPLSVAPGTPLRCGFNVTWNNAAVAGSLGARVDTPETSFYGQPASFDFTNPKRGDTRGDTADVFDDMSGTPPANATGVPTKWFVPDGSAPPPKADGIPLTTVDTREYTYTVQVGPFADKGSCGTYQLTNVATVVPKGTKGPGKTASATVSVSVTGCRGNEYQNVRNPVTLVVSNVTTSRLVSNEWSVTGTAAPANMSLDAAKSAPATYNVTFAKVPKSAYQVGGTVTVTAGPSTTPVDVSGLTVAVEATGGSARSVDAVCGGGGGAFTVGAVGGGGWGPQGGGRARRGRREACSPGVLLCLPTTQLLTPIPTPTPPHPRLRPARA
jgi:hypothetical protein